MSREWSHVVGRFREWDKHRAYLAGLDLVPPGLVYADEWRYREALREATRWHSLMVAGVGRVPDRRRVA